MRRILRAVPPLAWLVLMATPVWVAIGFGLGGWLGVGIALIVLGLVEIIIAAAAPHARRAQSEPARPDEVVGALYPREMRHVHRRKGVCTLRCRPKSAA